MRKSSRFGGRPGREPERGERVHLGIRVTPDMKHRIERAAEEAGRSQSQEAEYRLQRSLDQQDLLPDALELAYGRELGGLILMMATAMHVAANRAPRLMDLVRHEAGKPFDMADLDKSWADDPLAFEYVMRAAITVLEAARPRQEHEDAEAGQLFMALQPGASGDTNSESLKLYRESTQVWLGDLIAAVRSGQTRGAFADPAAKIRKLLGRPMAKRLASPSSRKKQGKG